MEFQLRYFRSWEMILWTCCTQYASKFGKLSSGHRTGKGQFSFQSQRKAITKECSDYHTVALISHTSKVMLKILQARLQQYVNHELPDIQARFRKGRGTRDQIGNICWIIEKVRDSRKHLLLLYWVCQSLWLCGSKHTGKFFKKWEYETTLPAWEICMQIKKQQLELDMEQQERKKKLLIRVKLVATLRTVAYQAPLSMGFFR